VAKPPKAKRPPEPATDPPWIIQIDQNALPGNLVPALARLLLVLVEQVNGKSQCNLGRLKKGRARRDKQHDGRAGC
jgi:hypothetical protein